MNLEFQIHGVLSSGQARWKQDDKDYYSQFYSGRPEDVLMTVEIVNRPHGISTYYNYLRNNNILSSREGSYFGMTVRIDGAFCKDVRSIYMILDNLFNKMILGKILVPKGNDKYEYAIDSFANYNDELVQIEKQFSNMFNAFFSPLDFFEISSAYASQGAKFSSNISDITIGKTVEAVKQKAKLYLSPLYLSSIAQQKVEDAKANAENIQKNANAKILAGEQALIESEKKWKKEKEQLEVDKNKAINDLQQLKQEVGNATLDRSINEKIAEIKQPIIQLAGLMSERFPEKGKGGKGGNKGEKLPSWIFWTIGTLLVAIVALLLIRGCSNKTTPVTEDITYDSCIKKITQLEDSIKKITNPLNQESTYEKIKTNEYDGVEIDIPELKRKKLQRGMSYTFNITGENAPKDGNWEIFEDDVLVSSINTLKVSEKSVTVKAVYSILKDGKITIVKERIIDVE